MSTDAPGARTVNEDSLFFLATYEGEYFTFTPENLGVAPVASVMVKVSVGVVDRAVRGSLRSFNVSSPVLTNVATTFSWSTPVTASGPTKPHKMMVSIRPTPS